MAPDGSMSDGTPGNVGMGQSLHPLYLYFLYKSGLPFLSSCKFSTRGVNYNQSRLHHQSFNESYMQASSPKILLIHHLVIDSMPCMVWLFCFNIWRTVSLCSMFAKLFFTVGKQGSESATGHLYSQGGQKKKSVQQLFQHTLHQIVSSTCQAVTRGNNWIIFNFISLSLCKDCLKIVSYFLQKNQMILAGKLSLAGR